VTIRLAPTPAILYRIGRAPDPLAFPPLAFCGTGRYDDPLRKRSVLYAAMDRRAAFLETLDAYRADLTALADRDAALTPKGGTPSQSVRTIIPARFFSRQIVRFSVGADQRWLDVRSPETHAILREELGAELENLGFGRRFVLGDLLSNHHHVTQLVAGWSLRHGFHGLAYSSCHNPALTCWAIFEGADVLPIEPGQLPRADDPDLLAVAGLWNLEIPRR
jgi:hypothetical protein